MCEPYQGEVEVCNNVLRVGVDHVFVLKSFGSQKYISEFLQVKIPRLLSFVSNDYCHKLINKTVCNYYLMPCGSEDHEFPPSSICHEECFAVQSACPVPWETMRLGLSIDCSDTSALLFPLPNCCTGVGISSLEDSFTQGLILIRLFLIKLLCFLKSICDY